MVLAVVDAQRPLLVHVGMSHGDDNGIDRDIHHDDIQNLKANVEGRDCNNVEPPGPHGCRVD